MHFNMILIFFVVVVIVKKNKVYNPSSFNEKEDKQMNSFHSQKKKV